ncbi:MAG TPA: peptidyl-alpha-hydroxyglycine alpha-amidating lyase family protein [Stellaceae bacterium]|jgi:sugar lactone lactonase YvrE|nr:peptidyl-alpha-hydroxyglycine alpha-amidating lyase family protein [Stellaceae bacterium]
MNGAAGLVGHGEYTYELAADWAKLPAGWTFKDVAAVATDKQDRVYVFNRGEHPLMVFDRDGNLLNSWGEGVFHRPHGLHMGPDETIYCTDDGDHTVRKCTLDGKILLTIGIPGRPSPFMSNQPFNRCTHTALSPDQEIYVSDGYANAAVHKYDPSGRLLHSWGECGCDPGQFNIPHNICCDPDGWVYVADRENHRVQIFDGKGKYESQWNNLHRPCGLYMSNDKDAVCYIGELGSFQSVNVEFPNIGPRLTMVSRDGRVVGRVDQKSGLPSGQFVAPHGLCVDSHGDVYVGEVSWTAWEKYLHPDEPRPVGLRSLQKLVRKKI